MVLVVFVILFKISVLVFSVPIVSNPITDKVAETDTSFQFEIPTNTFTSLDGTVLRMKLSHSSLTSPDWLNMRKLPRFISSVSPPGGYVMYAYARGDLVYSPQNIGGFLIINATNKLDPELVSRVGGFVHKCNYAWVDERGDYAYISNVYRDQTPFVEYLLHIVDISDKKNPIVVHNMTFPMLVYGIFEKNDVLFVCNHKGGLKIYNVTNKTSPTIISSLDTKNTRQLEVKYNYRNSGSDILFLADTSGCIIVNITDLSQPTIISTTGDGTNVMGVFIHEEKQLASLYNWKSGFILADISDLLNPVILTTYGWEAYYDGYIADDGIAYMANYRSTHGLQVFDVRDPSNIVLWKDFLSMSLYSVERQGDYLYIGANSLGMRIYAINGNYLLLGTPDNTKCGDSINFTVTAWDDTGEVNATFSLNVEHRTFGVCTVCFEYDYDSDDVCSSHGNCTARDRCECFDGYFGPECSVTTCWNIFNNYTEICSGHGDCFNTDICECHENYYGLDCSITLCSDIFSNETDICSKRGNCTWYNNCTCEDPSIWFGLNCNTTSCGNIGSKTENVCSGHGICTEFEKCFCSRNYYGQICNISTCYGHFSNSTSDNGCGNGTCVAHDDCNCEEGYYGDQCEFYNCHDILFNDTSRVCTGHGVCIYPDHCVCSNTTNYYPSGLGKDCSIWECYDRSRYENQVCSYHGTCIDHQNCSCDNDDWRGGNCEFWSCWNTYTDEKDRICGGHGTCIEVDKCFCIAGYFSNEVFGDCDSWYCGGSLNTDEKACSGRGECVSSHHCICSGGYEGSECETWSCGVEHDNPFTCSGHGKCKSPNVCECVSGYSGELCQTNDLYGYVLAPVLGGTGLFAGLIFVGLVFLACLIMCFCLCLVVCLGLSLGVLVCVVNIQKLRMKKFDKLKDVDLLLRIQEMEDDDSVAHLKIDQRLFEIPYDEIRVGEVLGEGGSQSIVFRATWRNEEVAFKVFKTQKVCSTQDDFDDFEKEVTILSSLSHPHIVRFFGATINPPRVGIVMEFCSNGELLDFFKAYRKENDGKEYDINEKIRMCNEIVSALSYCHSRNIIHRDLKCENVLVDAKNHTKLMDFGLSKVVDHMSTSQSMTKSVGTSIYMSPEVVQDDQYDSNCDVFSFAIMFFVIVTENAHPYGVNEYRVEFKVASNPKFRPDLKELDEKLGNQKSLKWVKYIIKRCWDHVPSYRLSFTTVSELFREHLENVDHSRNDAKTKIVENEEEAEEDGDKKKSTQGDPAKLLEEINSLHVARKKIEDMTVEMEELKMSMIGLQEKFDRSQKNAKKWKKKCRKLKEEYEE